MIVSCRGIISVARKTANRRLRPGKRSRAKAKAAIEQAMSWPSVARSVTLALLSMYCRNGDEAKIAS